MAPKEPYIGRVNGRTLVRYWRKGAGGVGRVREGAWGCGSVREGAGGYPNPAAKRPRIEAPKGLLMRVHPVGVNLEGAISRSSPVWTIGIVVSILTLEGRIQALANVTVRIINITATVSSVIVASYVIVFIVAKVVAFVLRNSATSLLRRIQAFASVTIAIVNVATTITAIPIASSIVVLIIAEIVTFVTWNCATAWTRWRRCCSIFKR